MTSEPLPSPVPGTQPEGAHNEHEARRFVRDMFSRIAPRYDLLNHLLSLNLDRIWRRRTAEHFRAILSRDDARVLDLCCGTGDLSIALREEGRRAAEERGAPAGARVYGSDFAQPMLLLAREKVHSARGAETNNRIDFLGADALSLPFRDANFDLVTAAFGFRNLVSYEAGLREILRVLKPGGEIGILEFGSPHIPVFAPFFRFYFRHILPRVGGVVSGSNSAYSYLPASVFKFPSPSALASLMIGCGFTDVHFEQWSAGIVTLHSGRRP